MKFSAMRRSDTRDSKHSKTHRKARTGVVLTDQCRVRLLEDEELVKGSGHSFPFHIGRISLYNKV